MSIFDENGKWITKIARHNVCISGRVRKFRTSSDSLGPPPSLRYFSKNLALARVVNGILQRTKNTVLPSYKAIHEFLTLRIRGLTDFSDSLKISDRFMNDKTRSSVNNVSALKYVHCHGNHIVLKCEDFLRKSVAERSFLARQLKLCFNCLKLGHFTPKYQPISVHTL